MADQNPTKRTKVDPKTGLVDVHDDPAGHDFPPRLFWVPMLVAAAITAAANPLYARVFSWRGVSPVIWLISFVFMPAFWLSHSWFHRRLRTRVRRRVHSVVGDQVAEALDVTASSVLGTKWDRMSLQFAWTEFGRALAKHSRVGHTFRTGVPASQEPIEPITVPFEPTPLNEAEPSLLGLEDATEDGASDASSADAVDGAEEESVALSPAMKRNITFAGGGWAIIAFLAVMGLFASLIAFREGRISLFVFYIVLFGASFFGFGWRRAWCASKQWLLVPGGVVVRTSPWFSRGWTVHLFDRRTSVLGVHQADKRQCIVCVADAETHRRAVVTHKEATFLLRAWLSPLPPPSVEQLSDLR